MFNVLVAALQLAAAQMPAPPTQSIYHGRNSPTVVPVPRMQAEVKLDGVLDDAVWKRAALLTGFSQFDPVEGAPAPDSTEIYVWYDEHQIYFGVRAFEPHGAVNATLANRDKIFGDDYVDILLDTFNDHRRAYEFVVNPFGIQGDGVYSETPQTNEDFTPDFIFQSKGRVTDFGYEIEVRIPFKSIGYTSKAVQDWGIQIIRRVQHSGENQTWAPAKHGTNSLLNQNGTLQGLTQLKRGLVLDLNPVFTTSVAGHPVVGSPYTYDQAQPELGGNLRWGVSTNLTLNATINPDFSQIEADASQTVFDPRQALFFPEKRPFFLENSEQLSVPMNLIYTRQIVSPIAAAKFTGKVGGTNVGFLSAVDDPANTRGHNPVYNILRLKRDVAKQSALGLVYTDRELDGDYNRVAGLDTRINFKNHYTFFAQFAASMWQDATGSAKVPAYQFALQNRGREFGWNVNFDAVHDRFVAGSGFISRPGIAHSNTGLRWTKFGQKDDFIQSYTFNPLLDNTWDYQEFVRGVGPDDIKLHFNNNFTLTGGWRVSAVLYLETFRYPNTLYANYYRLHRLPNGDSAFVKFTGQNRIPNHDFSISVNTPQFSKWSLNSFVIFGRDENFDEWAPGYILFTQNGASYRPTDKVRAELSYIEQRTVRPHDFTTVNNQRIPRLKLEYQVSRPVFVRFVGQYVASERAALRDDHRTYEPLYTLRNGSYVPLGAIKRNSFRGDVLFSYQPTPGTVLFAGYGSSLADSDPFAFKELARTSDGLFVKLSYLFRM